MRLSWSTDIHLNFLPLDKRADFAKLVAADEPDAVVVTGDISEAPQLAEHLAELQEAVGRPVHFVLGNHDYYRASIARVRALVRELTEAHSGLSWLPAAGVTELTPRTALIGIDGWGDARVGNWQASRVRFKDISLIEELTGTDYPGVVERLRALGDAEAAALRPVLAEACSRYSEVMVATHTPPFLDACWHEGRTCHPEFLPWLACVAVGEVLVEAAEAHADCQLTVLCGHTHGEGTHTVSDNLVVHTGGAVYGAPAVSRVFEVS